MRSAIEKEGIAVLVINTATGPNPSYGYDISREEVLSALPVEWKEISNKSKGEKIKLMTLAVAAYLEKMFKEQRIHGVIAAGGLQNTVMATAAMQRLPIGFPKVMATTIASGRRRFEDVVGEKDIVVIPSICDFTGLNIVTRQIIDNACACCVGMVKHAGGALKKGSRPVVGVTLMGVTNTGACAAIEELERMGVEAIGFHATGTGGAVMEQMAEEGLIDGILDMNIHEITSGYFQGGFSYSEKSENRMERIIHHKIPWVVTTGGLDFVDFNIKEFPDRMDERIYMMHNAETAHIKILPDEAVKIADIVVDKLDKVDYPVKLLLPTDGMRSNTQKGQELYCREVDRILTDHIRSRANSNIEVIEAPGNLDTVEWGIRAAHYMIEELYGTS